MPKVTQGHRDRQRAKVLSAAKRCFARRGFHATSMDEIIAETGMSSSTVYRYFPQGKDSLIEAVVDGWTDPLLEQLSLLSQAGRPPSLEEAFVQGLRRSWVLKGMVPAEEGEGAGDQEGAVAQGGQEDQAEDPQEGGPQRGRGKGQEGEAAASAAQGPGAREDPSPPAAGSSVPAGAANSLVLEVWAEYSRNPRLRALGARKYWHVRSTIESLVRQWQQAGLVTSRLEAAEVAAVVHNISLGLVAEDVIMAEAQVEHAARAVGRLLAPEG